MSSGHSLPFTRRPSSVIIQNRRSPTTPEGVSSTVSGWLSPSDFTGAIETRVTRPFIAAVSTIRPAGRADGGSAIARGGSRAHGRPVVLREIPRAGEARSGSWTAAPPSRTYGERGPDDRA